MLKEIQQGVVLLIPDIHQDTDWATRILNIEDFDHVVFMGDYFDSRKSTVKEISSIRATINWLNTTYTSLGDKATWLLGNHDYSYLSTYQPGNYIVRKSPYICSGWTRSKATQINKYLNPGFFYNLDIFVKVYDYTISHAGVHPRYLHPILSIEESLSKLNQKWKDEQHSFRFSHEHWLGDISVSRKGNSITGSPIWIDWDEFEPITGLNQIVGHTCTEMPRYKGSSNLCIDTGQKHYAVLSENSISLKQS